MSRLENVAKIVLEKADCFIVANDINRFYLTNLKSSAGFIVGFKDKTYLIIDSRYIEKARDIVVDCEVVLLEKFYEQLKELLIKHNAKTILLETFHTTLFAFERYKEKLPDFEFLTDKLLSQTISDMRLIKTDYEIECIKKAQEIAEKAFEDILGYIHQQYDFEQGQYTEREVTRLLENAMLKYGADAISFDTIVLSGKKSSMPHGVPSDDVIGDGFLLFDFGAVYNGYHSDMTRTVFIGEPTDKMWEVYYVVLEAQKLAISAIRTGVSCKDLDAVARDYIKSKGYGDYFGHSLGHGVGLEIHEEVTVSEKSKATLQTGNVITIEPGIYLPKEFGVRIEDFVVVTDTGCINLTNTNKEFLIL
ncbi:aminopeptidase Y [Clostridia bacterium]|nr:aminopeptidase Y [Clostridia bacterium]